MHNNDRDTSDEQHLSNITLPNLLLPMPAVAMPQPLSPQQFQDFQARFHLPLQHQHGLPQGSSVAHLGTLPPHSSVGDTMRPFFPGGLPFDPGQLQMPADWLRTLPSSSSPQTHGVTNTAQTQPMASHSHQQLQLQQHVFGFLTAQPHPHPVPPLPPAVPSVPPTQMQATSSVPCSSAPSSSSTPSSTEGPVPSSHCTGRTRRRTRGSLPPAARPSPATSSEGCPGARQRPQQVTGNAPYEALAKSPFVPGGTSQATPPPHAAKSPQHRSASPRPPEALPPKAKPAAPPSQDPVPASPFPLLDPEYCPFEAEKRAEYREVMEQNCRALLRTLSVEELLPPVAAASSSRLQHAEVPAENYDQLLGKFVMQELTLRHLLQQSLVNLGRVHSHDWAALLAGQQQELSEVMERHAYQRSKLREAYEHHRQVRFERNDQHLGEFRRSVQQLCGTLQLGGRLDQDKRPAVNTWFAAAMEPQPPPAKRPRPLSPGPSPLAPSHAPPPEFAGPGPPHPHPLPSSEGSPRAPPDPPAIPRHAQDACVDPPSPGASSTTCSPPVPDAQALPLSPSLDPLSVNPAAACPDPSPTPLLALLDKLHALQTSQEAHRRRREAEMQQAVAEQQMDLYQLEVEKLRQQKHQKQLLLFSLHSERQDQAAIRAHLPPDDAPAGDPMGAERESYAAYQSHINEQLQFRLRQLRQLRGEAHRVAQVQRYRRAVRPGGDTAAQEDIWSSSEYTSDGTLDAEPPKKVSDDKLPTPCPPPTTAPLAPTAAFTPAAPQPPAPPPVLTRSPPSASLSATEGLERAPSPTLRPVKQEDGGEDLKCSDEDEPMDPIKALLEIYDECFSDLALSQKEEEEALQVASSAADAAKALPQVGARHVRP